MSDVPFQQPGRPVVFEGQNFRRAYRERQVGPLYLIQVEIDKEMWDACALIPRDSIIVGTLAWTPDGVDEPVKVSVPASEPTKPEPPAEKPKPERKARAPKLKGPYSFQWQCLCQKGFTNNDAVRHALEAHFFGEGEIQTAEEADEAIRRVFGVKSRTDISMSKLKQWLEVYGDSLPIDGPLTMIENAEIFAAERQAAQEVTA